MGSIDIEDGEGGAALGFLCVRARSCCFLVFLRASFLSFFWDYLYPYFILFFWPKKKVFDCTFDFFLRKAKSASCLLICALCTLQRSGSATERTHRDKPGEAHAVFESIYPELYP